MLIGWWLRLSLNRSSASPPLLLAALETSLRSICVQSLQSLANVGSLTHPLCYSTQVINCRRVLKYTYVLGFFLREHSPEKQLFEHHQEMLEKNTERLQEYTELNLDQIDRAQVGWGSRVWGMRGGDIHSTPHIAPCFMQCLLVSLLSIFLDGYSTTVLQIADI